MNTSAPRKQLTTENSNLVMIGALLKILFVALFALILINAIFRFFVFTTVTGNSMLPTYQNKQLLVMCSIKNPNSYSRGDIIVAEMDNIDENGKVYTVPIIKRVIGLPGDTLYYDKNTRGLYVNGIIYDEPYIKDTEYEWNIGTVVVPDNHLFVMGDNRNESLDSRTIGSIPYSDIRGYIL